MFDLDCIKAEIAMKSLKYKSVLNRLNRNLHSCNTLFCLKKVVKNGVTGSHKSVSDRIKVSKIA